MITSGDISTGQAMIDKGKQTTQEGADKAEAELSTEEEESSRTLNVLFNAFQNQHYGFDGQYGQTALQAQYETLTHADGTYYIAWKSVKKGATGQVVAITK
jgi:surface antigen